MEALTQDVRLGLPRELLYAHNLVLMIESIEELKEKVIRWKECMEAKGLRMNTDKTKVIVSGKDKGHLEKLGKLPWWQLDPMYGMQGMGTPEVLRCEGLIG